MALAGDHAIMVVKTNHARSPKAWLEEKMKDFPGGTWLTLEGRTQKNVDLLTIGYKYNSSKVLTFVLSRGAGSTVAGRPYQARFPDVYGNVHTRDVPRPRVLNTYFDHCGLVDSHNQARQGNLALEESWITCNPYFRIWTTFLGIGITDLWLVHRRFRHSYKKTTIKHFADEMAFALLRRAQQLEDESARESLRTLEKKEKEMQGEYEFCQADLPDTLYPSGEHRETQKRCGVYEKFHSNTMSSTTRPKKG